MKSCPGCGMFYDHVPGCSGVVAVYMRYMAEYREDGFMSIEDAEAFLASGEDSGSLSSVSVELPDGTVARDRKELGYAWP